MKPRDFPEGGWSAPQSWEAEEKRGRGFDDLQDTGDEDFFFNLAILRKNIIQKLQKKINPSPTQNSLPSLCPWR